jgi:nucleoside-diphosphate-sugar epimerase
VTPAETHWTGKKVFVTGGASFIGSTLTDQLLARGAAKVRVVDDLSSGHLDNIRGHLGTSKVEFLQADLREPGVTRTAMEGIDTVFHLAADHGGRG